MFDRLRASRSGRRKYSRWALWFATASAVWAAAMPMAAVAAAQQAPGALGYLFAVFVYATGSIVCHQLPARSFHLWTRQLPVCARCTGIYAGAAIGAVVALAALAGPTAPTRGISARGERAIAVAACVPTAATLLFEWTTGVMPSNAIRAIAGAALGAPIAWLVARFLASAGPHKADAGLIH